MRKAAAILVIVSALTGLLACSGVPESNASAHSQPSGSCACSHSITVRHPVLQSDEHVFIHSYCDCGIDSDFLSAIQQKQLIAPSAAAEQAAVGLLTWYGSDFGRLTVSYRQAHDQVFAIIIANRKNSSESQHRCTLDAETGRLLEIADLRYDDACIGQGPADASAPTLASEKQAVLDANVARFELEHAPSPAFLQEARIRSVVPFAQGDYQWMITCDVRTADSLCYMVATPCPSMDGGFYFIKFFETDWDACRATEESIFQFDSTI